MAARPALRRCALYTRKSSEEGLDQAFNSLDAQREACAAYVKSQKAEGWKALPDLYDDGGWSGGTMERPALTRLLADIEAGRVDVVVVYKIDRLTRSLADFARMVDLFDRKNVSFVSVTQAFSTTTSMGRLTLNVLLSFAQFEREVTGERIRDKIAASKAKGFWMGGVLPLGYDKPLPGTRTLIVNETEAATVRHIFERYRELGSVHTLAQELQAADVRSKRRVIRDGSVRGGGPLGRGALFHLLRNRLYRGEIVHGTTIYPGLHEPIVEAVLFEAVQERLDAQTRRGRGNARAGERTGTPATASTEGANGCARSGDADSNNPGGLAVSPLTGRIFDADGVPMSPTFAYGKTGKLYRYYVSAPLQQGRTRSPDDPHPRRVSAALIETHLAQALDARLRSDLDSSRAQAPDPAAILGRIRRLEVHADGLRLTIREDEISWAKERFPDEISSGAGRGGGNPCGDAGDSDDGSSELRRGPDRHRDPHKDRGTDRDRDDHHKHDPGPGRDRVIVLPFRFATGQGRTRILAGDTGTVRKDAALIRALRRANAMIRRDGAGHPALEAAPASPHSRRLVSLAFLAPDLQRVILEGRQPQNLTLAALTATPLPLLWSEQRAWIAQCARTR